MAVTLGPALTVLFLLSSFGLLSSSPLHSCPDFCSCDQFSRLNCSSAGLSSPPQNIRASISDLDLSNNQLRDLTFRSKFSRLQKVWLGNNSVSHLSLCLDSDSTDRGRSRPRRGLGLGPWRRRRGGCLPWAPALQLLSVERNQLKALPEGLGQQTELQILNLSFNKILKMELEDLAHLKQLEELHLQNNLIVALQPQIFEKLAKLKVLDLSFNLLTTLHLSTFFSLRDFGTDVALRGNSWICDCEMRLIQSLMSADRIKGVKTWSIECSWPVERSGTELLELQGQDLICPDKDDGVWIQKDLTVRRGSRTLLTCSEPDAVWWTPNGQTARSQNKGDLIITDITEQDEGLYVCMSKSHQVHTIFNVLIHEKIRKTRSVPQEAPYRLDMMVLPRNTDSNVTQSHFAMAVSLSVIITFIVAFILGVLLQPYICACWQKTRTRKPKARATTTAPNAQQEEYINEAYLHCEDVDDFEPHRERRVTFTEYTEEGGMQYFDTAAGDVQESNGAVIRPRHASSESSDNSGSENGTGKRKNVNNPGKKTEFEHIPDSNDRGSLSSQSSISSKEVKILEKNSSTPNASKNTEEQVQKREVVIEVPQFTIESRNEIPGFSSEPFAEWSPHQNDTLDNGDQFEFSDSVRSRSPVSPSSMNGSFKQPNILVPNVGKKKSSASSSSSSELSEGEQTHYTVNPDSEDEGDVFEKNMVTPKASQNVKSSSSSDSDTEGQRVVGILPVVGVTKKEIVVKNELQKEEQALPTVEQKPPIAKKRRAPLPPPRKVSSSSSDSEDEIHKLKKENMQWVIKQPTSNVYFEEQAPHPEVDLDFKARNPANESFSSSDNEDERIYDEVPEEDVPNLPIYSKQESSIAVTDTKPQSGTSSSSESEEEQENYYENIQEVTFPNKSPNVTLEPEPLWPEVNLVQIPKVKRRLDFKRVVQTIDTSSGSDREDEQLYVNVTKTQEKVPISVVTMPKPGSRTSSSSESEEEQENYYENVEEVTFPNKLPVVTLEPEPLWPVINLEQVPKVKRRLDFKRTVPIVDASSSSSDSEGEATLTQVQEKVSLGVVTVPKPGSRTSSSSESEEEHYYENIQEVTFSNKASVVAQKSEPLWPVVSLEQIPKVKRRLDFKRTVPTVDSSSSSSDSEDDVTLTQVQGKVPLGVVTVPKPGSGTSSSSDSEEEQEIKVKLNQENLQQTSSAVKEESLWPVIDLLRIPKVKRRLDIKERINIKMTPVPERVLSTSIKVPKPESGTSSSSDSEDEQEIKIRAYQENLQTTISPIKPAIAVKPNQDSQWPMIDLNVNVPKVKQRLDIKTTQPASQSSSSDSEDERVKVTQVPEKKLPPAPISVQKPDSGSSSSSDSDSEDKKEIKTKNLQQIAAPIINSPWPVIDLERIPKVKQRLDVKERVDIKVPPVAGRVPSIGIKPPKQDSGTSSSSESEDEQKLKVKENLQQTISPTKPPIAVKPNVWPVIDLVNVPKVKQRLDIKTAVPAYESSSSDSEDERVQVNVAGKLPSKPVSVKKPNSGTSSSSDSEDERKASVKSQWPRVDLVGIPQIKRRLDIKESVNVKVPTSIKTTKSGSGTSASSDSEDERRIKVKVNQENLQQTISPIKPPVALKPQKDSQWPVIDLAKVPKVKQRLDIKTTVQASESSSSDSEDERVQINVTQVQGKLPSTSVPLTKSPQSESGTSSSSESEDERETAQVKLDHVQLVTSPTKQPSSVTQWPVIDPVRIPKLRRRLDIKEKIHVKETQVSEIVPSPSIKGSKLDSGTSSSSDSEDEQEIKIISKENLQQQANKQPNVESQWPMINLVGVPKPKQRLDVKQRAEVTPGQVSKPDLSTSSSSESEDESVLKVVATTTGSTGPQTKWPLVDLGDITRIKRRLDIKIPSQSPPTPIPYSGGSHQTLSKSNSSSSSSSDEEHPFKSSQVFPLPSQTNVGLDIKGPSMKPESHESSSSSDDENDKSKLSSRSLKSEDNKGFIKVSPILGKPQSLTKTTHNIELAKYKVITDDLRDKSSSGGPSPVVTPDMQSKWASMSLGLSRFRKRLDITKTSSPTSPPPISPKLDKLSTDFDLPKSVIVTEQVAIAPMREQNVDSSSSSSESEDGSKIGGKASRDEVDFESPKVTLSSVPKVKRSLNVTTTQKKSSSSSSSEEETANQKIPDLSSGIPQVKRRLNIKAPTPPPSSSCSDDEKVYAHKFSDVTDQRSIEYKRTIMKSTSYDSSASKTLWQTRREALHIESNAHTPKKLSLDNIKRKLLPSKQNELPPNLRWTSVGSHLSEHPLPVLRRHHDGFTSPPPTSSPPPMPKHDSSDSSSSEDEQKEVKTTVVVTQKTYSPKNVTFNTSPTILNAANFEDRPERRGLSALKAMSSERRNWESEVFTESAPLSVDYSPEVQTVYRRTAETKMSQAQSSPATEQRRLADMMYGIPSYKRHTIKSTELLEDPPPPVPSSALPDESLDFTWRSPQSSLNRGSLSYHTLQQKKTLEESVDEPFFDNPNISAV